MMEKDSRTEAEPKPAAVKQDSPKPWPKEIGGVEGPEPTRYGDWEHKGRCTDF
jgi:hypothetical protein